MKLEYVKIIQLFLEIPITEHIFVTICENLKVEIFWNINFDDDKVLFNHSVNVLDFQSLRTNFKSNSWNVNQNYYLIDGGHYMFMNRY